MMLGLQRPGELLAWPVEEIAMLREEAHGRLEATRCDGQVAHRPGPLRDLAPLHRVSAGTLVHPRYARPEGEELVLPGGWRIPRVALPEVPAEPTPEPLPGLPVTCREVLFLESDGHLGSRWTTTRGVFETAEPAAVAAARNPWLASAGRKWIGLYLLERAHPRDGRWWARMREGTELGLTAPGLDHLAAALEVPPLDPRQIPGPVGAMFRWGLRDFPEELLFASREALEGWLGRDFEDVVARSFWQLIRYRQAGRGERYGYDLRGFWYTLLAPIVGRLELEPAVAWSPGPEWWPDVVEASGDMVYIPAMRILAAMVGEERLTTYLEMGLDDPRPDLRRIGSQRPLLLLCAEKSGLKDDAFALAEMFGVSVIVLGGTPSLLETEHLLRNLPEGEISVITHVDWDVGGWQIGSGFVHQLRRYGRTAEIVGHLVRPERFTAWEIRNLSFPIRPEGPQARAKAEAWLRDTGGIGGAMRGIHSDHLRPLERLEQAFREEVRAEARSFPTRGSAPSSGSLESRHGPGPRARPSG